MIALDRVGRRYYLRGDAFPLRATLRAAGAHWDHERMAWWVGRRETAERIASGLGPADEVASLKKEVRELRALLAQQARGEERPSLRHVAHEELARRVVAIFDRSRGTYGSERICAELAAEGVRASRDRVAQVMRDEGLMAVSRRPRAGNVIRGDFRASAPNVVWVIDTTQLAIGVGRRLYLAAILDLYSRRIVGWSTGGSRDRHLTLAALDVAIERRRPRPGLVVHSDQGSEFAAHEYLFALQANGFRASMNDGNCLDNAVMESFFGSFKAELGSRFPHEADAVAKIRDYVDFFNRDRRHSALGYRSPAEYERAA